MASPRAWFRDLGLAAFTIASFILPFSGLTLTGTRLLDRHHPGIEDVVLPLLMLGLIIMGLVAVTRVYRHTRSVGPARLRLAYETLLLVWFPIWALLVNHFQLQGECTGAFNAIEPHRPLAEPWVAAPTLLHLAVSITFVVSRHHPERLRPLAETFVLAALHVGIALHVVIQIQLGTTFLFYGLVFPSYWFPVIAPALIAALFVGALRERLQHLGAETRASTPTISDSAHRLDEVSIPSLVTSRIVWVMRMLGGSLVLLAAYGLLSALSTGHLDAGIRAFTQTCEHTFSQLPVR